MKHYVKVGTIEATSTIGSVKKRSVILSIGQTLQTYNGFIMQADAPVLIGGCPTKFMLSDVGVNITAVVDSTIDLWEWQ